MLTGLDVSTWQGFPDWGQVAQSGRTFAICKATEGLGVVDQSFSHNWAGIKAAGMCRGAYHYAKLNDPAAEAAFFFRTVGAFEPGDLAALDLEEGTGDQTAWVATFADTFAKLAGFEPLFYSSPDHIVNHVTGADATRCPLWLADLSRVRTSCGPWNVITLRQYTFADRVPGIAGDVDGDEIERDLAGLKALGKPQPTPTYPYTTNASQRGDLKAKETDPKKPYPGKPSHSSPTAIDEHHRPVPIEVGADLVVTGDTVTTDDVWRPVTLPAPSKVHGWFKDAWLKDDS